MNNFAFHFFRSVARFIGSIFFPQFSAWGEDSFSHKSVIFARYLGFISVMNTLRFFKTPVVFFLEKSQIRTFWWKLMIAGGMKIETFSASVSPAELASSINKLMQKNENPLVFLGSSDEQFENDLIKEFDEKQLLFYAVVGCENCFSLGFIPVVRDMRAFCGTIPVFGLKKEEFDGIKCLEFLEKALRLAPKFEIPTFFCTHKRFLSQ